MTRSILTSAVTALVTSLVMVLLMWPADARMPALLVEPTAACLRTGGCLEVGLHGSFAEQVEAPTFDIKSDGGTAQHLEGRLFYDLATRSVSYFTDLPDVTMNVGQELWVRAHNNSGVTIANGAAVYMTGWDTPSDHPTIAMADADDPDAAEVLGLVTSDNCTNSSICLVTTFGEVRDINTSGFTAGAPVYLSGTPGQLTQTIPAAPALRARVGIIGRQHATEGRVLVRPGVMRTAEGTSGLMGLFSAVSIGPLVPGTNLLGSIPATSIFDGTRLGQVQCDCGMAGTGGTAGLFLGLFENGVQVESRELSGGDTNACNDAAQTDLTALFDRPIVTGKLYDLQVLAGSSDCLTYPADCACSVVISR